MDFEIPATKEEMYEVLEAIDLHYKGDLRLFEPPAFEALSLARMEYTSSPAPPNWWNTITRKRSRNTATNRMR